MTSVFGFLLELGMIYKTQTLVSSDKNLKNSPSPGLYLVEVAKANFFEFDLPNKVSTSIDWRVGPQESISVALVAVRVDEFSRIKGIKNRRMAIFRAGMMTKYW